MGKSTVSLKMPSEKFYYIQKWDGSQFSSVSTGFTDFDLAVKKLYACDTAEPGNYRIKQVSKFVTYEDTYPEVPKRVTAEEVLKSLRAILDDYRTYDDVREYAHDRQLNHHKYPGKNRPAIMGTTEIRQGAALGVEYIDDRLKTLMKGLKLGESPEADSSASQKSG